MRNFSDEVKYLIIDEKTIRSLTPKFDSKVSSIEEMQDLKNLTIEQLHGILTTYEMRKGCPSDIREATFKAAYKGKEKEELEELGYILDEEEVNLMKKTQVGTYMFRGKIPFKCFSYRRVGQYFAKCPYK